MSGFEGYGDFDSDDPVERYVAHQAAKGNWPTQELEVVSDDGTVRDERGNFVGIDQPAAAKRLES